MDSIEQTLKATIAVNAEQLVLAEVQHDPELKALVNRVVRRALERTLTRLERADDEGRS